jgi:hypothetical protein
MDFGAGIVGQLKVDMFKQVFIERVDRYHTVEVTVKRYLKEI